MEKKIPKRRNGYYFHNDKEYVSCTKVLGDVLAKPALINWAGKECAKIALRNPSLTDREVVSEFSSVQRKTQDRGKFIHSLAEALARGDRESIPTDNPYAKALLSWWDTNKPEVIKSETEVYDDDSMVAGRLDLVCRINNEVWLIDFKTGKNIYKEVGLQLAFYAMAIDEPIDKTGVALFKNTGEFLFKETKDTYSDFIGVLNVWKWLNKKGEL